MLHSRTSLPHVATSSIVWAIAGGMVARRRLPSSGCKGCRAEGLGTGVSRLTLHCVLGWQGTAATEAAELFDVYGLSVVEVPTNKPSRRQHMGRYLFINPKAKYLRLVDEVRPRSPNEFQEMYPVAVTGFVRLDVLYG